MPLKVLNLALLQVVLGLGLASRKKAVLSWFAVYFPNSLPGRKKKWPKIETSCRKIRNVAFFALLSLWANFTPVQVWMSLQRLWLSELFYQRVWREETWWNEKKWVQRLKGHAITHGNRLYSKKELYTLGTWSQQDSLSWQQGRTAISASMCGSLRK